MWPGCLLKLCSTDIMAKQKVSLLPISIIFFWEKAAPGSSACHASFKEPGKKGSVLGPSES